MESETLIIDLQPRTGDRVLAAVGPLFLVAISYVDPGKWAAAFEGGAQLGFDLILLVLLINFVAILCQYLSAHIAISTGRNLAQICSEEYNTVACVLLGIQAEISMIMLDLTMVLGTAYGLNAIFGINLYICVLLTGCDAILVPFLVSLLGNSNAKIFSICLVFFLLVSTGVVMSIPEHSLSVGGILKSLSAENSYALMGILGANLMPHNFYLHSSIVQQHQRQMTSVSKGTSSHDHFFATVCIFCVVFLVNCILINVAANVFYSSGLSLTLEDVVSLMDQGFSSSLASVTMIFSLFLFNQLVLTTWGLEKQVIANEFFGLDIPRWLHFVTLRILVITSVLFCAWTSGAERMFQLLIFAQVLVALLLPSSLIPLFRIASSRSIMGSFKISNHVEFLALLSFVGVLGLNIIFVIELMFGSSDWVTSLKWNVETSMSTLYLVLLIAAFTSLFLMLWLATTPLKSASSRGDERVLKWDIHVEMVDSFSDWNKTETEDTQNQFQNMEEPEPESSLEKSCDKQMNLVSAGSELDLPETFLDSEKNLHLNRISDNKSNATLSKLAVDSILAYETVSNVAVPESVEVRENESFDSNTTILESHEIVEKTLKIEGDRKIKKDENRTDPWAPDELTKYVSKNSPTLTSEGPRSFRSLRKIDDVGSGEGSLIILSRAARRQLASILDEFWGQLFDYHGQVTPEAKAKRLDVLLGVDSKVDSKSSSHPTRNFPSTGGRGPDLRNPSEQVGQTTIGSPLGAQQGSLRWPKPDHLRLLESLVQDSSHSALDASQRHDHSVHGPLASEIYAKQPNTIHGLSMASYLSRMAKDKQSEYPKGQLNPSTQVPSLSRSMDMSSRPLAEKQQNGLRAPPGFHNVPTYRNSSLKFERPTTHDLSSPEPVDYNNSSPNEKKFHSLPNISGLYASRLNSFFNGTSPQWDHSRNYGHSSSYLAPKQTALGAFSRENTTIGVYQHFPSKDCGDAFPLQFSPNRGASSLWSKQPYEHFGVEADKASSRNHGTPLFTDMEAKLLQSFRFSIMKLLKLEGSSWLFRQNDGADEDLIDRVAAREKFLFEVENMAADRNLGSATKLDETDHSKFLSVPNCGDGCIWRVDLMVSFGIWCIHRILEISLVESRPELWGKYTYVLNRLQGVIDLAFSKPRTPASPCFCLQLPAGYLQQKLSSPLFNSSLPPQSKVGRGKVTTASMLLDLTKDVELAISCRKGRSGTAAGDVAFPKGKENLASVLKRYKRYLSNRPQEAPLKNVVTPPLPGNCSHEAAFL